MVSVLHDLLHCICVTHLITVLLQVRVKQEMVNDESRVKCTVATMGELDLVAECKQMIDAIHKYK